MKSSQGHGDQVAYLYFANIEDCRYSAAWHYFVVQLHTITEIPAQWQNKTIKNATAASMMITEHVK